MDTETQTVSNEITKTSENQKANKFMSSKMSDDPKTLSKSEDVKETIECSLEGQLDDLIIIDDDEFSRLANTQDVQQGTQTADTKNELFPFLKQNLSKDDKLKSTPNDSQSNDTKATHFNDGNSIDVTKCLPGNNITAQLNSTQIANFSTEIKSEKKLRDLNQTKGEPGDSLILTADDELETEMGMSDKNDVSLAEKSKKIICKSLAENQIIKENRKNNNTNESISEINGPACINLNESSNASTNEEKTATNLKIENKKTGLSQQSKIIWISNISQSVKATDLKQFISKAGKVVTAKIVTDGKKCYGYVVMSSVETVRECLKSLNNETFDGRRITVSLTKPSIRTPHQNSKEDDGEASKPKRKSRSPSTASNRRTKRRSLTTKFDRENREYRHTRRSRSKEKRGLITPQERERLRRRIFEEQVRHREEIFRSMQREEKQREMEFKLEQEHRKLQLEKRLFERERRELNRLDVERRKIERERIEVLRQRTKLADELEKLRLKSKCSNLQDETRQDRKLGLGKEQVKQNKISNENIKNRVKTNMGREERDSRARMGDEFKMIPPPSKLNNELDVSLGRKMNKHLDRKYDSGERKTERGGHKIEVIDRKYYVPRYEDDSERKHDRTYRKPDTEDRKVNNPFTDRKFDCNRDAKRFKDGHYFVKDNNQRTQWHSNVYNNEMWKPGVNNSVSNGNSSAMRYPENNFSGSYNGPIRVPSVIYHPIQTGIQQYRYDHYQQVPGRKY